MAKPAPSTAIEFVLAALVLLMSCGRETSPTEPPIPPRSLPTRFRITGTASSSEAGGVTVTCALDLVFQLEAPPRAIPGGLEYDGTHGGRLRRTILNADGSGLSLEPDVFGRVVARSVSPNRVQIVIPVNVSAEGRFWRELSQFDGTFDSTNNTASGTWKCAPFDIDSGGRADTMYVAPGAWRLFPNG